MKNIPVLNDPEQIPYEALFKQVLSQQLFQVYKEIGRILEEYGLTAEWRYYNDGKSWLYKITNKKKTITWISLGEDLFKSSFYFTEKTRSGIENLEIDNDIKSSLLGVKPIGKLIPLTLEIRSINELDDFKKIMEYKLSLK